LTRRGALVAVLSWLVWAPLVALAADGLGAAEARYAAGDFAGAESHFRQHLRGEPGSEVARFRAGQTAMALHGYGRAGDDFERVAAQGGALSERASFMAGLASYRLRDYVTAAGQWGDVVRSAERDDIAQAAQYGRAWCAIHRYQWPSSREELKRVTLLFPGLDDDPRAPPLLAELRRADALPMRSPTAAKWMSTIAPGVGQVYAGRVANGIVSAGLNGAFLYFLGRAVTDGRWVDALFIYVGGSRFYWGGRQNAEKFARARNDAMQRGFVADLARYDF
jgi:hypothetical protein